MFSTWSTRRKIPARVRIDSSKLSEQSFIARRFLAGRYSVEVIQRDSTVRTLFFTSSENAAHGSRLLDLSSTCCGSENEVTVSEHSYITFCAKEGVGYQFLVRDVAQDIVFLSTTLDEQSIFSTVLVPFGSYILQATTPDGSTHGIPLRIDGIRTADTGVSCVTFNSGQFLDKDSNSVQSVNSQSGLALAVFPKSPCSIQIYPATEDLGDGEFIRFRSPLVNNEG